MTGMDFLIYIGAAGALIVILGLLIIALYALSIAHDLAKIVLQSGLQPPQGTKPAVPPSAPIPAKPPTTVLASAETPVVDAGLVAYIKKAEGFSAKAQWDYKQYTNGYGTKAASANEVIDEATAEQRLTAEINKAEQLAEKVIPAGAPKGLKQALTDLTYNAGAGWEDGSLGAAVKALKMDTIKADILLYNHAGGQVLAGLTARREAEVSWIDNPL